MKSRVSMLNKSKDRCQLLVATGPWTLLTGISAFDSLNLQESSCGDSCELVVVLWVPGNTTQTTAEVMRMATHLRPSLREIYVLNAQVDDVFLEKQIDKLVELLSSRFRIDGLLSIGLHTVADRRFQKCLPRIPIHCYDDSIESHSPEINRASPQMRTGVARIKHFLRLLYCRARMSASLGDETCRFVLSQHRKSISAKRVAGYYLMCPELSSIDSFPLPPERLPRESILKKLRDLSVVAKGCVTSLPDADFTLVVGSHLAASGQISGDSEHGRYRELIDNLVSQGKNVLWKPHPRSPKEYLEAFTGIEGVHILPELGGMPIEVLPLCLRVTEAYSFASASLIHLQFLFGVRCFHLLDDSDLPAFGGVKRLLFDYTRENFEKWRGEK